MFYSLQGEGRFAGVPSAFIRLAGCPLRCRWCDTKYAWLPSAGQDVSILQITEFVEKTPAKHVVITGGEPMVAEHIAELANSIKDRHITIETAGIVYLPKLNCRLMSISPKLSNSGVDVSVRLNIEALRRLISEYDYQLKFIIDNRDDMAEIKQLIAQLPGVDEQRIMLMPNAAGRREYLEKAPVVADMAIKYGYCFSPRLQALLWDNCSGR